MDVNDTLAATTYSRACYGSAQNLLQCSQYPQQQLPWKFNQNATCPFTNDLCIYGDTSAYEIDSGLIDSHHALGINAPKSERIEYRKVTTCKLIVQLFTLARSNSTIISVASCVSGAKCILQAISRLVVPFQERNTDNGGPLGSPIHTRGYATEINDTNPDDIAYGDTFQQFSYGPFSDTNYTYEYDTRNLVGGNGYLLS